jgi:hypothetical protein
MFKYATCLLFAIVPSTRTMLPYSMFGNTEAKPIPPPNCCKSSYVYNFLQWQAVSQSGLLGFTIDLRHIINAVTHRNYFSHIIPSYCLFML